ncbi:dynactin [Myriangium duriaei CBS 260.36]|uniref:Dynactin subunit 5 n=1 Tax=Myriangium duriaei CBS 260.36 TaxID=1168546 RepID=A0A9P4MI72_9PEZI|nr:dynactin [Myriangium duriaei CBS 260.36]
MSRSVPPARKVAKSEYIETETGNKISRKARIEGKPNIMLGGKTVIMAEVCLRGDLHRFSCSDGVDKGPTTSISIGRYAVVATGTTLRPPCRISRGQMAYYPIRIGDNVFIGPSCMISAISISSHVYIGANCVLSPFCIIKENCKVLPNTVVPANMVVPPSSVVGGNPGRVIDDVGEGWGAGTGGPGEDWVEGGDLRELVRSIK